MIFLSKSPARFPAYLLLVALGVALLAPVWLVRYPPLVDYPNHLGRAFVLAHLDDPRYQFTRFYSAHWGPSPYWALDLTLIALQHFMSVELAGRLFLSLCLLAAPLATWVFVRQANPGNDSLALWSLLAAYNYFLFYGFLNLQLSIAVCLLAVGLWLRYLATPSTGSWVLLLFVVSTLYFVHLGGFVIAGFLVTGYCVLARRRVRELLLSWLLFVPGACLYLTWRLHGPRSWPAEFRPFREKFAALAPIMQGYSPPLDYLTLGLLAVCALAAWWRNPDWRWNRPWAFLALALFGLYWVLPESYGTGWPVDQRILPFFFLLLPAVARVGRRARVLAAVAVVLFLVRTANVAYHFVSEQPELASMAKCFSMTPVNATVLPVVEAKNDESFLRAYPHFWAYGVIERGWLSPYLFAQGSVTALRLQPGVYLEEGFWDLEYEETPDWDDVRDHYDYVWAYNVPDFLLELREAGRPVCERAGLALFELKESPSASSHSSVGDK